MLLLILGLKRRLGCFCTKVKQISLLHVGSEYEIRYKDNNNSRQCYYDISTNFSTQYTTNHQLVHSLRGGGRGRGGGVGLQ